MWYKIGPCKDVKSKRKSMREEAQSSENFTFWSKIRISAHYNSFMGAHYTNLILWIEWSWGLVHNLVANTVAL